MDVNLEFKYVVGYESKLRMCDALVDKCMTEQGKMIIFVATKRDTGTMYDRYREKCLPATMICGDVDQCVREQRLKGFKDGKYRILVATDVASRGLDVPDITFVVLLIS